MREQKSRTAAAGIPRLRNPDSVGMRGSSQPWTSFSSTSFFRYRLLITVFVMFSRANSICRGLGENPSVLPTQSYKGR